MGFEKLDGFKGQINNSCSCSMCAHFMCLNTFSEFTLWIYFVADIQGQPRKYKGDWMIDGLICVSHKPHRNKSWNFYRQFFYFSGSSTNVDIIELRLLDPLLTQLVIAGLTLPFLSWLMFSTC